METSRVSTTSTGSSSTRRRAYIPQLSIVIPRFGFKGEQNHFDHVFNVSKEAPTRTHVYHGELLQFYVLVPADVAQDESSEFYTSLKDVHTLNNRNQDPQDEESLLNKHQDEKKGGQLTLVTDSSNSITEHIQQPQKPHSQVPLAKVTLQACRFNILIQVRDLNSPTRSALSHFHNDTHASPALEKSCQTPEFSQFLLPNGDLVPLFLCLSRVHA